MSDFVTDVDRNAERVISDKLLAATPGVPVIGEELSPDTVEEGLAWVVDPLDGTTNYLHGFPAFAVSIAAVDAGVPVAGVVLDVSTGDEHHAGTGSGAFVNDTRLAVSSSTDAAAALIGTGFPFKHPHLMDRFVDQFKRILLASSGIRRAGSAALDLCSVAKGHFEGFWELHLAPWDVAAGIVLVREAGGIVTDLDGTDATARAGGFVAGNPAIHRWLLSQLDMS